MAAIAYSNADKLMAVVELWSKPMVSQLPLPYSLIAPAISPLLSSMLSNIPDESIPEVANGIIDDLVQKGSVTFWKVTLDRSDLSGLQELIQLNLPCEKRKPVGYEVKTSV